jgi:hypothetical protein
MTQELDHTALPETLQEIVQLIGMVATLKLVGKYGGTRLYVPKRVLTGHPLAALIGRKAADTLADYFGGEVLEIPRALSANVAQRNVAIKQEYRQLSQRQLALKYNLTERQVRNIVTGDQQDDQMQLFDN